MEPSVPKNLFEEIARNGEAAARQHLESLVNSDEKTFETQYLEFKSGRTQNVGDPWSQELSAFANSDGGIIIWGIGTARHNGVDYAATIDHVAKPLRLKGELEKYLQHGTDPPLSGVEVVPVPSSDDPGFVVCFVSFRLACMTDFAGPSGVVSGRPGAVIT